VSGYKFPEVPEIEDAYRAAHRALEAVIGDRRLVAPEKRLHLIEVLSQFPELVREADMAAAGQVGPRIGWRAERMEEDWQLNIVCANLDEDRHHLPLTEAAYLGESGDWHGSGLDKAGRAYRREAGWDFAPGEAGVWLLMLAPVTGFPEEGGDLPWRYSGHLAGFVILYDRDEDGTHETVGHVWTAAGWRRRGIATRLLAEARTRFSARHVEGPFTEDGAALVEHAWKPGDAAGEAS
jgi:ribosomal protein S18 acetylase RimI-like enzyme